MAELPSGTVTFLFSDVEGSTELLRRLGDEGGARALAEQTRLLRAAFSRSAGHEVDTQGDSFFVAFARASDAINAAADAQRALATHDWPSHTHVRVRMALLTGEAHLTGTGYAGLDVHRAARICAAGHGGQVLIAQSSRDVVEDRLPDGLALRDLGEHRLKDLQRREHIYQLLIAGLRDDFPPLRTLEALPNNLPLQLTSFVGREKEMADVARLLADARLLTLTGPGGTGKTRLALQVAADVLDRFPDGAWLIELASLADAAAIPGALAGVLGVREAPGRPLWESLVDFLRGKQALVILDNCEHLVEGTSRIVDDLLHICPRLRILATSREVLGIAGETSYRVPSLPLPAATALTAATALESPAIRLFVERATTALPSFSLTDRNAPAVVQICQRLDGIPLAVELAAARVRALAVEQLAARLDDRFRLLTGGSRTALPRHQTLRALIDWSYELLSPEECALLRRLSVFAGGWTLEAADHVGGELDILELLPRLIDKSLVQLDEQGQRYRMLETVRQYASDKLLESREAAAIRDRHLRYFLALAEEAEPAFLGAGARRWLDRLTADADNLSLAVEWAMGADVDLALRLIGVLKDYMTRRGLRAEGRRWAEQALALTEGPAAPGREHERERGRANVLLTLSMLLINQSENARALDVATRSATLWRRLDEKLPLVRALSMAALAAGFAGHQPQALALSEEALGIAREHGNPVALAMALTMRARAAMELEHDYDAARAYAMESQVQAGLAQYTWNLAMQSMGLGIMTARLGDYPSARRHLSEGIERFAEEGDSYFVNVLESELADVARRSGEEEEARRRFAVVLPEWRRLGNRGAIARVLECLGFIARSAAGRAGNGRERTGLLERMARLCGAAGALREIAHAPMVPSEQEEYETEIAAGKLLLPADAWNAAWFEGRALGVDEAIALALNDG